MCNKEQNYSIDGNLTLFTFNLRVQPFGVSKGQFSTGRWSFETAAPFLSMLYSINTVQVDHMSRVAALKRHFSLGVREDDSTLSWSVSGSHENFSDLSDVLKHDRNVVCFLLSCYCLSIYCYWSEKYLFHPVTDSLFICSSWMRVGWRQHLNPSHCWLCSGWLDCHCSGRLLDWSKKDSCRISDPLNPFLNSWILRAPPKSGPQ